MLLPEPVQSRSRDTVRACITAAVELLDEGVAAVTVEAVHRRSGVATGSLYHHFGDLDRLLAVARAVRAQRSIEVPVRAAVARYAAATTVEELARITRAQVVGRDTPEARAAVRALTDAIAAARDRPELRDVVAGIVRAGNDRMDAALAAHRDAGRIASDAHPRAILLVSRAFAHVRLLDDLDPRPVPHRDWVTVACRVHDGLIDPRPLPPPARLGPDRRDALAAGFVTVDLSERTDGELRVVRLVERARDLLLAGGPELVQVARLRTEQGVSAGWFHRTFGDRAGLLAAARLDLLERTLAAEVRSYAQLAAVVRSPAELVEAVAGWVAAPDVSEAVQRMRWQRADVVVAAHASPALGLEAGRVVAAATDEIADVTRAAQDAGLLRPELAPRAIARVVQSMVFGPLLAELDGTPIAREDWRRTVRRALTPLVT